MLCCHGDSETLLDALTSVRWTNQNRFHLCWDSVSELPPHPRPPARPPKQPVMFPCSPFLPSALLPRYFLLVSPTPLRFWPPLSPSLSLLLVPRPSGQVVLSGHEDQRDLFVSGAQQRKHSPGELGGSGEAVDLWSRLHVIKGHLTLVHIQEHAHLTELRRTLHLHSRQKQKYLIHLVSSSVCKLTRDSN